MTGLKARVARLERDIAPPGPVYGVLEFNAAGHLRRLRAKSTDGGLGWRDADPANPPDNLMIVCRLPRGLSLDDL